MTEKMSTDEFDFNLPDNLIAQVPPNQRGQSRLLVLNRTTGTTQHTNIKDIVSHLPTNSVIVMNNSRVRKARLLGLSDSGAIVEFLLLGKMNSLGDVWTALVNKAKKQKVGKEFSFPAGIVGVIQAELPEGIREIRFSQHVDDNYLDLHGHIPLPPYIQREDKPMDADRYQTIYSQETGSVAAPTAGLHFTDEILRSIDNAGITRTMVTLHVGLGTFIPVRSKYIEDHHMHEELYTISEETAEIVNTALREKRPILALGTTSVRTLESAWDEKTQQIKAGSSGTSIFIYPGYSFNVVNVLFTNFHTPKSTLLMLVSAFAGKDLILSAYEEAVKQEYRFFSYGDAMLIL